MYIIYILMVLNIAIRPNFIFILTVDDGITFNKYIYFNTNLLSIKNTKNIKKKCRK